MRIIACVKYVPQSAAISDDSGSIPRDRFGRINPADMFAIEEAARFKERVGSESFALCMGVTGAADSLKTAIAMGMDHVRLLTDTLFAGSDTLATSYILAKGIENIGNYDLILCGKSSTDGDTGQVAQEIAARLGIPCLIHAVSIELVGENEIECRILSEAGYSTYRTAMPAVVSVMKGLNQPRIPSLGKLLKSKSYTVEVADAEVIGADPALCGHGGSATKIKSARLHRFSGRASTDITADYMQVIPKLLLSAGSQKEYERGGPDCPTAFEVPARKSGGAEYWAVCEGNGDIVTEASLQLLSKVFELAEKTGALPAAACFGKVGEKKRDLLALYGASKIYELCDCPGSAIFSERSAETLIMSCNRYKPSVVVFPSTVWGHWIAPYAAAKLSAGLTADCFNLDIEEVTGSLIQTRLAFGGNIVAEIFCPAARPQMATVKANVFPKTEHPVPSLPVVHVRSNFSDRIRLIGVEPDHNPVYLSDSPIVLAGGHGIGGKENFRLLYELAELVGGSAGASRYAVDSGWADYDRQVGQTGFAVKPNVYIAFGISGASEHIIGMRESECIISVNKDSDAPLNALSDYVVAEDCLRVLGSLIEYFKGRRGLAGCL